jgi:hypothetical protein
MGTTRPADEIETDTDTDFADEHDSASHAAEERDEPGMEPDEDTPESLGGMD